MSGALFQTGFATRVLADRRLFRHGPCRVSRQSTKRRSLMTRKSPLRQLRQKGRPGHTPRRERVSTTKVQSTLGFISHMSVTHNLFDAAVNSLVGGSAMICFALAFVPLLTYEQESGQQMEPDDLDTIKWSVAGFVSFFPYLNWTVERVAQTEPAVLGTMLHDEQEMTSVLGDVSRSIAKQISSVAANIRSSNEKREKKEGSLTEMVKREIKRQKGDLHDAEELARIEQNLWDKEFDADKDKQS